MKKAIRKLAEAIKSAGSLLGRLLGPRPALRPVPIRNTRR